MSLQTMSDIQRLLNPLIELNAMVTEENPAFLREVDLHTLHTLLVENLFAVMRGGSNDTPQVLDSSSIFIVFKRADEKAIKVQLQLFHFNKELL